FFCFPVLDVPVAVVPKFTVERSKSCVADGGRNADIDFSGAPHMPGTMYTTKANTMTANIVRGTDRCCNGLSCAKRILPIRYSPSSPKIAIQRARKTSLSSQFQW